jgi:hypothetical protein
MQAIRHTADGARRANASGARRTELGEWTKWLKLGRLLFSPQNEPLPVISARNRAFALLFFRLVSEDKQLQPLQASLAPRTKAQFCLSF